MPDETVHVDGEESSTDVKDVNLNQFTSDEANEEQAETAEGEEEVNEQANENAEEEPEFFDSDEDFLNQYNLPGQPKTLEDAMTSYQAAIQEMNRLKQAAAIQPSSGVVQPQPPVQPTNQQFFERGLVSARINNAIENGSITPENAAAWKAQASMMDNAFDGHIAKVEEGMTHLARSVKSIMDTAKNNSWRSFTKRYPTIGKESLDPIMDQMGYTDYNQALQYKAAVDPNLLRELMATQRNVGQEKERKRKVRKTSAGRRSKATKQESIDITAYQGANGQLDSAKLAKLSEPEANKIIAAWATFKKMQK